MRGKAVPIDIPLVKLKSGLRAHNRAVTQGRYARPRADVEAWLGEPLVELLGPRSGSSLGRERRIVGDRTVYAVAELEDILRR